MADNWLEVARAIREIAEIAGIKVSLRLKLDADVMCCTIGGITVNLTRVDVEDRNFVELYKAFAEAKKELFPPLVPAKDIAPFFDAKPASPTATEIALRQRQQLYKLKQMEQRSREIENLYLKYVGLAQLKEEGKPVYTIPEVRDFLSDPVMVAKARDAIAQVGVIGGEPTPPEPKPKLDISPTDVAQSVKLPGRKIMLD